MVWLKLLATVAAAVAGAFAMRRFKTPALALTGAIAAVTLLTLLTGIAYFPAGLRRYVQILSGALIGTRITRSGLREMPRILLPVAFLMVSMLCFNVVCVGIFRGLSPVDTATAMFGCAPGGMTDFSVIAEDYGADPVYVTVMQLCRVLFVNLMAPVLFQFVQTRWPESRIAPDDAPVAQTPTEEPKRVLSSGEKLWRSLLTVAIAAAGGLLFARLGVPAGSLLGAVAFTTAYNAFAGGCYLPRQAKKALYCATGCYIGVQFSRDTLRLIAPLLLPIAIMLVGTLVVTLLLAVVIHRFARFDMLTSLLMSTPGGLGEMSIIADDYTAHTPQVLMMHSIRVITSIAIFPQLVALVGNWTGA